MQNSLTLRPNKLKMLVPVIVCLGFTLVEARMIVTRDGGSWLIGGVFGLGVLVFIAHTLPNGAYLLLTAEDFTVCSLFHRSQFKWAEVERFDVARASGKRLVVFNFTSAYRGTCECCPPAFRAFAGYQGSLPDTYNMRAEALANLMNEWRERALESPSGGT